MALQIFITITITKIVKNWNHTLHLFEININFDVLSIEY